MKIKNIGIFVCALLFFSAISGADDTNLPIKTQIDNEETFINEILTTETRTVWLKFFIHDECTKNISQMVADCNDIYDGGGEGEDKEEGIIQFTTDGSITTLPDSDFNDLNTSEGREDLLRKLKTDQPNCSHGINVVIAPDGLFNANGMTYFNKGSGTNDKPYGGVILRDTCNQDQMNKTLAHELLHALGLSHEQVKWRNPETGEIESKPIGSTIEDYYGPGHDREIPASACGYPVPPHGYAYYDEDGDCDCEDTDQEQPLNDEGQKIWDIDGDCEFGGENDTDNLLWGRANRTNVNLTKEQKDHLFGAAGIIPEYRKQYLGQPVDVPKTQTSKAKGLKDTKGDVGKKFIDIIGGLIIIYFEHGYIYLGLETYDLIPEGLFANYYYFIDIDNDITTGDPSGFDYLVDLLVRPDYKASALSEWDPAYEMFIEISTLNWDIAIGAEDSEDSEDCNENEVEGMVIRWQVPMDLLIMDLTGDMRIVGGATDEGAREYDSSPDLIISKEPAIVPVLNLDPYNGGPGVSVTCYGYDFTPNSNIKIEFDCRIVGSTTTDGNGDFTTTFNVPSKSKGYYTLNAYDSEGRFHTRIFYIDNQAPNAPTITGPNTGKTNTPYDFTFNAIDLDGDNVRYLIDWGDTSSDTTGFNPSGSDVTVSHSWTKKQSFTISAKAEDSNGLIGPTESITINIPRTRDFVFNFNLRAFLLEQFPNSFLILKYVLGLR